MASPHALGPGIRIPLILTLAVWTAGTSAVRAAIWIPVSEDESVITDGTSDGYAARNNHYKFGATSEQYTTSLKSGLWTGKFHYTTSDHVSHVLTTRFFLKFNLPALRPYEEVVSAVLWGYYCRDHVSYIDQLHDVFLVEDDSWREAPQLADSGTLLDPSNAAMGITWNNQPTAGTAALATFDPNAVGLGYVGWNITDIVGSEYAQDGVLSLMFKARDESAASPSGEYFLEKEENSSRSFGICLTTRTIPEPYLATLLGPMLAALLGVHAWKQHCSHKQVGTSLRWR